MTDKREWIPSDEPRRELIDNLKDGEAVVTTYEWRKQWPLTIVLPHPTRCHTCNGMMPKGMHADKYKLLHRYGRHGDTLTSTACYYTRHSGWDEESRQACQVGREATMDFSIKEWGALV